MKFACICGKTIVDQTDYLSYAAYMIADQDIFDASDISEGGSDDWWGTLTRKMYQCRTCGRLWINDRQGHFHSFAPEQESEHILSSVHGNEWKRVLRGIWLNQEVGGFLNWRHLSHDDYAKFDDWNTLERAYVDQFAKLRKQNILRDALLNKDGKTIHSWESEPVTGNEECTSE